MSDDISWFYKNAKYLNGYTFAKRDLITPLKALSAGYYDTSMARPGDVFESESEAKKGFLKWKKRQISYLENEIKERRKKLNEFKKGGGIL